VCLVAALAAGALGGLADVAKAALVRHHASLTQALAHTVDALRGFPLRACFGWLPFAALFLAAALLAAKLTEGVDVSRSGAWRVVAVLLLHQSVIFASIALRAGWLARALRLSAASAR
jgi:hypothetical protein